MGEITTNLQEGRHASRGGVKGCRKLRRPLWNMETRRDVCLYRGHVWCECGREHTDAAPSGTRTKGCTEPEDSHCR